VKAQGFDRTIDSAEDEFGRGFLVDHVYNQLMAHDADWSVRVALNGDWGSGKSSIAEMIGKRARDAGHPVGWLYPWRVHTIQNVASALMVTVLAALEEANIRLSPSNTARKVAGPLVDFLTRFKGLHPAAEVGFGLLEDANSFDAEFAEPIAQQLAQQSKRLLVIIDDMDRCDPALLPPLLLFMRSALDIPSFSFLAPFDSDIVAKTIHASNRAWTNSDRFLEKVFDFRIPIPDLTNDQKSRFTVSRLAKAGFYVSDRDVNIVASLLPATPRAIKALVRDIELGRAEIERRTADEISWPTLLTVTMLRATSLEFFRMYRRELVDNAKDEQSWRHASDCNFDELWDLIDHPDGVAKRRVLKLVKALEEIVRDSGITLLRRTFHFTDEYEPVTWKEFERFVCRWRDFNLAERSRNFR
jgi:KAP family P-loop domain